MVHIVNIKQRYHTYTLIVIVVAVKQIEMNDVDMCLLVVKRMLWIIRLIH